MRGAARWEVNHHLCSDLLPLLLQDEAGDSVRQTYQQGDHGSHRERQTHPRVRQDHLQAVGMDRTDHRDLDRPDVRQLAGWCTAAVVSIQHIPHSRETPKVSWLLLLVGWEFQSCNFVCMNYKLYYMTMWFSLSLRPLKANYIPFKVKIEGILSGNRTSNQDKASINTFLTNWFKRLKANSQETKKWH